MKSKTSYKNRINKQGESMPKFWNKCSIGFISGLYGALNIISFFVLYIYSFTIFEWCILALSINKYFFPLIFFIISIINSLKSTAFADPFIILYPITLFLFIAHINVYLFFGIAFLIIIFFPFLPHPIRVPYLYQHLSHLYL